MMSVPNRKESDNWMYECLAEAKSIIKRYHTDYDTKEFFDNTTYELYIQNDKDVYAYLGLHSDSSHFPIGIHYVLSENNLQNQKTLVIVLIHGLLHAIHGTNLTHDEINRLDTNLATLGGYLDTLMEIKNLVLNENIQFCSFSERNNDHQ